MHTTENNSSRISSFLKQKRLLQALTSTLMLGGFSLSANASLVATESFLVDANNYTSAATVDGLSPDGTTPFAASDAWSLSGSLGAWGDIVARDGSLSYTTAGNQSLDTSGGKLDLFRTSGSGSIDATRALASPITESTWDDLYFSLIINVDNATISGADSFAFNWDHQAGTSARQFGFTLEGATGNEIIANRDNGSEATGQILVAGDNLLVFRVTDKSDGLGHDEFEMWLNPTDLSTAGSADYSLTITNGLVLGNVSFGFDQLNISQDFDGSGDSVLIDEFRIATTWSDALPFTTVPEPSSYALILGLVGVIAATTARRRK